jgi:6-phospho-3-hexuloisomerase
MPIRERMMNLADKISAEAEMLDESSVVNLINEINRAKRVFLAGAGRSGFVAKAFAMRLMHIGYSVYVVGESTTPSITSRDLLITVSGSGETYSMLGISSAAKNQRARVIAITSNPRSKLATTSDSMVIIKGRIPAIHEMDYLARQVKGAHQPLVPLGTLFEISTMVFFDSLVEELMVLKKRNEAYLRRRHTNLE